MTGAKLEELISDKKLQNGIKFLILIIFPILLYVLVVSIPIPTSLTDQVRNGTQWAALGMILLLYPIFKRQGWLGELWGLSFTMILFGMALSWVWNSGYLDGNVIGGLLPWSDAQGYLSGAEGLLAGQRFSLFASRRPLFASLFSVLYGISRHNLQINLAILGAMTALACYFCAREIRRTEGPLVGAIVLVVEFIFFRFFIGKVLTESLGLTLGALGLALLWRGARLDQKLLIFSGITTLTLAENARAGALLILPLLVLWAAWYYRGNSLISLKVLGGGLVAVSIGFGLNFLLLSFVGASNQAAFSNFSYTLYGLAAGNKGWSLAYTLFPNAAPNEIYQHAFELMRRSPLSLVDGLLLAYKDYLNPFEYKHLFIFMFFIGKNAFIVNGLMILISGLGLIWSFLKYKSWQGSLIIAATIGILISIPFAPPIDSDNMRVYAATIPFIGLVLGLGSVAPVRWIHNRPEKVQIDDVFQAPLLPLTGILIVITIFGALIVKWVGRPVGITADILSCPARTELLTVRISKGSYINLVGNGSLSQSFLPDVRIKDFRKWLPFSGWPFLVDELKELMPGETILVTRNENSDWLENPQTGMIWLILDTKALPEDDQLIQVCGKITDVRDLQKYYFYHAVFTNTQSNNNYQTVNHTGSNRYLILYYGLLFFVGFIEIESLFQIVRRLKT